MWLAFGVWASASPENWETTRTAINTRSFMAGFRLSLRRYSVRRSLRPLAGLGQHQTHSPNRGGGLTPGFACGILRGRV
jgi:hypothetical protein